VAAAPWWLPVNNSDWRHPSGPGSTIEDMYVVPLDNTLKFIDVEALWNLNAVKLVI